MANITVRSGCLAVAVDLQGNIAMVGTEGEVTFLCNVLCPVTIIIFIILYHIYYII